MISVLFVEEQGTYSQFSDLDLWPETRDARKFRGPGPAIAHPPCKRWGRYWSGGPSSKTRLHKGDDDGCFAAALWAVRTFGGVIEHPEASHAWKWFGIQRPNRKGGWTSLDDFEGRSCCVEQGHYGHRARKATWLYAVGCKPAELIWGASEGERLDAGFHSTQERRRAMQSKDYRPARRLSSKENLSTPRPFAEALIRLVDSCSL